MVLISNKGADTVTDSMTREKAIFALKQCQKNEDTRDAHEEADGTLCNLLIDLGYEDVVQEWEKVNKWYA